MRVLVRARPLESARFRDEGDEMGTKSRDPADAEARVPRHTLEAAMEAAHVRAAREFPVGGPTLSHLSDVFPIFALEDRPEGLRVVACTGTGFRRGHDLLVTCWHCVHDQNYRYGLTRTETDPSGGMVFYSLDDLRKTPTAAIWPPRR